MVVVLVLKVLPSNQRREGELAESLLDAALGGSLNGTLLVHHRLEGLLAVQAAAKLVNEGAVGRAQAVDGGEDKLVNLALEVLALLLDETEQADQSIGVGPVAAGNLGLLSAGEALVEVRLVNGSVKDVQIKLKLVKSVLDLLPAVVIVATLEALDKVGDLLSPVGKTVELLADNVFGQNLVLNVLVLLVVLVSLAVLVFLPVLVLLAMLVILAVVVRKLVVMRVLRVLVLVLLVMMIMMGMLVVRPVRAIMLVKGVRVVVMTLRVQLLAASFNSREGQGRDSAKRGESNGQSHGEWK